MLQQAPNWPQGRLRKFGGCPGSPFCLSFGREAAVDSRIAGQAGVGQQAAAFLWRNGCGGKQQHPSVSTPLPTLGPSDEAVGGNCYSHSCTSRPALTIRSISRCARVRCAVVGIRDAFDVTNVIRALLSFNNCFQGTSSSVTESKSSMSLVASNATTSRLSGVLLNARKAAALNAWPYGLRECAITPLSKRNADVARMKTSRLNVSSWALALSP